MITSRLSQDITLQLTVEVTGISSFDFSLINFLVVCLFYMNETKLQGCLAPVT